MGFQWRGRRHCERAARSLSLRLDGELSELEEVALDRHLVGCVACRTLAAETAAFTALLRAAPLVGLDHELRVELPRRPRRARAVRHAAAAAVVLGTLAAAGAGALVTADSAERSGQGPSALVFSSDHEQWSYALMQQLRLEPWRRATVVATAPPLVGRVLL
jgi:anti-sigma factor RsiW